MSFQNDKIHFQIPYVPYVIKKSYEDIVPLKVYKGLFNEKTKCNYIDRYGNKCCNVCLLESPFKHRTVFCWKHIQENIDTIIKMDYFVYSFFLSQKEINKRIESGTTYHRIEFVNREIQTLFKKLINMISKNYDLLLMVNRILVKIDSLYVKIFNHGIRIDYDMTIPYELRLFMYTKCQSHIDKNKKEKNECLYTLKNILNTNNEISSYLHNTNMFDQNLMSIIVEYI